MSDKPWAVVQNFGALGARIKSTHGAKWLAVVSAAFSVMPAVVHPTEHARRVVARTNSMTTPVFDENGNTRYITEYEDCTIADVARQFNVSELTIRRGIKEGALRAYDLDGERLVPREDVEALRLEVARCK